MLGNYDKGHPVDTKASSRSTARPVQMLVAVSVATFLLMLDLTVVNVAIDSIARTLSADFLSLQLVINVYSLGLALFVLPAGALGDRIGRDRVFRSGLNLFIFASLLCGLAPSVEILIAARGVQGIAAAALFATAPALIADAFPVERQAMAYGVFGAMAGSAIAFGPLVGGILVEIASWRWVFLINVPLGLLAAWLIAKHGPVTSTGLVRSPMSMRGMATFIIAATGAVAWLSTGTGVGFGSPLVWLLAAVTFAGLFGFILVQRSEGADALIPTPLLRNRAVTRLNLATLLNGGTVMASIFLLTAFVEQVWGMSALEVGVRFLPLTLTVVVGSLLAGILTKWLSNITILGLAMMILAAGLGTVPYLAEGPDSLHRILPSMVAIGLGMGLFNPPRAALAVALVPAEQAATSTGTNETAQQLGAALGIATFGALYASTAGSSTEDLRLPLVAAAIVACLGGVIAFSGRGRQL